MGLGCAVLPGMVHACLSVRGVPFAARRRDAVAASRDIVNGETSMLTAHELAALFLVHRAPEQIQIDRDDVVALVEQRLIEMRADASGARRPALTPDGLTILQCVQRHDGRGFVGTDA
ncbi:hypothetical protein BDAG_04881 [Burkholderia dolosa AU0158]|nr:hypothetical protein BDAG_04881 [Burkholderia dolosa AU0158]